MGARPRGPCTVRHARTLNLDVACSVHVPQWQLGLQALLQTHQGYERCRYLRTPALDLAFAEIGNHDHRNVSWTLDLFEPLNSRRQVAHSLSAEGAGQQI